MEPEEASVEMVKTVASAATVAELEAMAVDEAAMRVAGWTVVARARARRTW